MQTLAHDLMGINNNGVTTMCNIIASPGSLIAMAKSDAPVVAISLPHAYEAAKNVRRINPTVLIDRSAPSIAGKMAIVTVNGGQVDQETIDLFTQISPVCGMKDGRVVNTTGHVLPFVDEELDEFGQMYPSGKHVDGYPYYVQRVDNEWYYYQTSNGRQLKILQYLLNMARSAYDVEI